MLAGACVYGLLFTFAIVLPGPRVKESLLADLYLGRVENPRWGGARRREDGPLPRRRHVPRAERPLVRRPSRAPLRGERRVRPCLAERDRTAALLTFFVVDYLTFERVHLYTYDLFAERVGFKLGWGCLVFYPFFYGVGLWSVADRPDPQTPVPLLAAYVAVFFSGWALSRGANLQKFLFKTRPDARLSGCSRRAWSPTGRDSLLCSGFWGLSRHINYLGEILMALGWRSPRLSRVPRAVALPPLLRGAPCPATARRRQALRGNTARSGRSTAGKSPIASSPACTDRTRGGRSARRRGARWTKAPAPR